MASDQAADVESQGFFGRNRVTRLISGFVITAVLIVAYLFGIRYYWTGLGEALPRAVAARGRSVGGDRPPEGLG